MDARRLAYLDAMDIDVWVPRGEKSPDAGEDHAGPRLVLGEGEGDILCLVGTGEEAAVKLAADISRAMRCAPTWGWPVGSPGFGAETVSLENAVSDRLITRVLVFGEGVASAIFGASRPDTVGTARVHLVPGIERLGSDRAAKRKLWELMLEQGIAAGRAARKASR